MKLQARYTSIAADPVMLGEVLLDPPWLCLDDCLSVPLRFRATSHGRISATQKFVDNDSRTRKKDIWRSAHSQQMEAWDLWRIRKSEDNDPKKRS